MRDLTRRFGTLLVFDETHTISTGHGGYSRTFGPSPDMFVLGKPVAGGVPAAVYGFTNEVAERMERVRASGERTFRDRFENTLGQSSGHGGHARGVGAGDDARGL